MTRWVFSLAILAGEIGLIAALMAQPAGSANQPGFYIVGPVQNGQCLQVQATGPVNGLVGVPCVQAPAIAIGSNVSGSTPNSCLTVDANNKLVQTDCLTAN